mgnify:CR=1 FL=1
MIDKTFYICGCFESIAMNIINSIHINSGALQLRLFFYHIIEFLHLLFQNLVFGF